MKLGNRLASNRHLERTLRNISLLAFSMLIAAGCAHRVPVAKPIGARITGTVIFAQKSAVPPDAIIDVTFSDVTQPDSAPIQIGHQTTKAAGKQQPFPFEIVYDARQIVQSHIYAVEAKIKQNERILFSSDQAVPVLTAGRPSNVEIVVRSK